MEGFICFRRVCENMLQQCPAYLHTLAKEIRETTRYYHSRRILQRWNEYVREEPQEAFLIPHEVVNALVDVQLHNGRWKRAIDIIF